MVHVEKNDIHKLISGYCKLTSSKYIIVNGFVIKKSINFHVHGS